MARQRNTRQEQPGDLVPADTLASVRAEAAVLGSVMLDNALFGEVSRRLTEGDFWREAHRVIFRAMSALYPDALDTVTLNGWLQRQGLLKQANGLAYIAHLSSETPAAMDVNRYLEEVLLFKALRGLRDTAMTVLEELKAPGDGPELAARIDGLLSQATQPLRRQTSVHRGIWTPAMVWAKMEAEADRARELGREVNRISTGLPEWDRQASIPRGLPVFLGARPGVGKSLLALHLRLSAARVGVVSRSFLLEDIADNEEIRALGQMTGLTLDRVRRAIADGRRNPDWHVCHSAQLELERLAISWDDAHGVTADQLALQIRQAARDGVELVVVDHIGRVRGPSWLRHRQSHDDIAYACQVLTDVCAETGVAMVIIGHLNRDAAAPGQEPLVGHIAGTDWIERNARVVLLLHNPEEDMQEGKELSGARYQPLLCRQAKANHGQKNVFLWLVCDPTRGIIRAMAGHEKKAFEQGQKTNRRMWQILGQTGPQDEDLPI